MFRRASREHLTAGESGQTEVVSKLSANESKNHLSLVGSGLFIISPYLVYNSHH